MGLIVHRCRWFRDRLPLLAGGELTGRDRREVERHLITCSGCRDHERSLSASLAALRSLSATTTSASTSPSLWPALQRQIREGRHAARTLPMPLTLLPSSRPWDVFVGRRRAVAALAAVLGGLLLTSAAVAVWARRELAAAKAQELIAARALESPFVVTPPALVALEPGPLATVARSDPAPANPGRPASRFDYDLDRGTPMGDGGDIKASY